MEMKVSFLFLLYFSAVVRSISYSKTRLLGNNPDSVLHYDVINGLFVFKLEAIGTESSQIGLAFSTEVSFYETSLIFRNAIFRILHRMDLSY